jgi:hypothetical protein
VRLLRRKPRPAPVTVAPEAVVIGLRTFAADLEAGDTFALDCLGPRAEMPWGAEEWADYPSSYVRRVRIAHLGKPGPGEVPDEAFDRFDAEMAASH